MPWVESETLHFTARHESSQGDAAHALLEDLESFRRTLEGRFERMPGTVAVVIHPRPAMLTFSQPWLAAARLASAPAGRRYIAGWFARNTIHVLARPALEQRARSSPGSAPALRLTPRHEYAHLVLAANNPQLPPPFSVKSFRRYVAAAWLCEGGATYFAGQLPHLRAAVARRLREGGRPAFPPEPRDAWILGGTVYGLLEHERGPEACVELAATPDWASGPKGLERAFDRQVASIEAGWNDWVAGFTAR